MGRRRPAPTCPWLAGLSGLAAALALSAARADEAAAGQPRELVVALPEGGAVALSTRGPSAFRVRVLPLYDVDGGKDRPLPLESPMVQPDAADASFTKILWTDFGPDQACRYNGSDHTSDGYSTTSNRTAASLGGCRSLCEQASSCLGIEWGETEKRCEFWSHPIGGHAPLKGHRCFAFTDQASHPRAISVPGLGSLEVTHKGQLVLRGAQGQLLTQSEPVGNPARPPHAIAGSSHPGGWFQGTSGEIGSEQVWSGDGVFLRAHTGRYLQTDEDQVVARARTPDTAQRFVLETKGGSGVVRHGDIVYLYDNTGSAVDVHGGRARARWDVHGQWQEFIVERKYGAGVVQGGDKIFLKANDGRYLDVEEGSVAARYEEHGSWQTLVVENAPAAHLLRSGDGLFLEPSHGKLLEASGEEVLAEEPMHNAMQRLVVEKKGAEPGARISSGDTVFLWTAQGKTLDIEGSSVRTRTAERGKWQEVVIKKDSGTGPIRQGDRILLKAHSGSYVRSSNQGLRVHEHGVAMTVQTRVSTCTQTYALNGTVNASTYETGGEPWRAVNGDTYTGWVANASQNVWATVDLGGTFSLSRVEIRWGRHLADSYFLQTSVDGRRWETAALALGREGWVVTVLPQGSRGRWVRILKNTQSMEFWEIFDVAIHGCQKTLAFSTKAGQLYGKGAATYDAERLTSVAVQPQVCNRATFVPYYWSTDGYGALAAVAGDGDPHVRAVYPASYVTDGKSVSWGWLGAFELFLMPAPTLAKGTHSYFALTGAPRVPPKYAFGFIASRWGWKNRDNIEDTLQEFRERKYPLDAFMMDVEWYATHADYDFGSEGKRGYQDFGVQSKTLPNPREQLQLYKKKFHVRTGAIRKARLGNDQFLKAARMSGWLLPGGVPGGQFPADMDRGFAPGRNLNFSMAAVRDWYSRQLVHLLNVGIDFWWNDEGETDYFTYHFWNTAEVQALRATNTSHRRFFSLNRAFTPGLARLGAAVWSGNVDPSWEDLRRTPGIMLNFGLAGAPYVACDIGGFSGETRGELLMRWMQVGTFLPIMRVHSWLWAKPHWPWLFGESASRSMREALQLRYRLIPYHYSLAHGMFARKELWIRPLVMDFPDDQFAASLTSQWMDGNLMVAPVLREDSHREVYVPSGIWYHFNSSHTVEGPVHLGGHATEEEIPVFVRPGTVLPLAPVVESTDGFPGGPIEIQVYAGADGSFELVEDDGETVNYEVGRVRSTTFRWYDSARTLSWRARGSVKEPGEHAFTQMTVLLFDSKMHGRGPIRLEPRPLEDGGSITPDELKEHRELQV